MVASGSESATSATVRWRASGVRSSCEALATNWRWDSNARSSRASSSSKLAASSPSSSRRVETPRRSCRLSSVIARARRFITRSGTSARPATSQPSTIEISVMIPSAIQDLVSSEESEVCF